jgi:GDP-4-dehydro-6-deoxy-D-mannose reductase
MKVLITGIEGFVGRHLAVSLRKRGHEPCGTVLRDEDLKSTEKELGDIPLSLADLRHGTALDDPLSRWDPDSIVHLAAQSSGSLAFKQPVSTYRINVLGTLNVLETVRKNGWGGRILVISSGEVYGNVKPYRPLREEDLVAPVNHYATSKVMAEMLADEFYRSHGVRTIRSRAFPHTGPGQSVDESG